MFLWFYLVNIINYLHILRQIVYFVNYFQTFLYYNVTCISLNSFGDIPYSFLNAR